MKKLSSKQMFTYVALFGVLALILVYVFVYKKNVEKTEALVTSNNTLEERVNSLQVYADKQKQYEADMEVMEPQIGKILETYPAANLEEDVIMQAVITQSTTPIDYLTISIDEDNVYKSISEDVVLGADVEAYQKEINFVETKSTYENTLTYSALKSAIQTIFDSEYIIGIDEISYTKGERTTDSEEGFDPTKECDLNGRLDLVFYSVQGNGQTYKRPDMTPYLSGTTNFFSDLMAIVEVEAEEE